MPLSPNKRKRLEQILAKGDIAIVEILLELEDKMENIPSGSPLDIANQMAQNILKQVKGEKGDSYVLTKADKKEIAKQARELVSLEEVAKQAFDLITIPVDEIVKKVVKLIPKPEDGKTPTREELEPLIRELLPQIDEDGITARTSEIVTESLKQLIPEQMVIEDIRNGLETLQGDDRLDKGAIKGLDDEFKKLESLITSRGGGGGTSAIGIANAMKYALKTEQPTGDIDGVNTTYTVSKPIFAVLGLVLNGEHIAEIPNYTLSGKTVTFSTALPAAYSGKDFEIKYF